MNLEQGIIFIFFIVMVLWTIKADFFLIIFTAAAYLYLLFIPIHFKLINPSEIIIIALDSVMSRIHIFFIFLTPFFLYSIYLRIINVKKMKSRE